MRPNKLGNAASFQIMEQRLPISKNPATESNFLRENKRDTIQQLRKREISNLLSSFGFQMTKHYLFFNANLCILRWVYWERALCTPPIAYVGRLALISSSIFSVRSCCAFTHTPWRGRHGLCLLLFQRIVGDSRRRAPALRCANRLTGGHRNWGHAPCFHPFGANMR